MRVFVSAQAIAEVRAIHAYLATESPQAAARIREALSKAIDSLGALPSRGRPSSLAGYRELVVPRTPYLVVYRVLPDAVRVMRVRHVRQDPTT